MSEKPNRKTNVEIHNEVLEVFRAFASHFVDDGFLAKERSFENLNYKHVDRLLNILYTSFIFMFKLKLNANQNCEEYKEMLINLVLVMPMAYGMSFFLNRENISKYINLVILKVNSLSKDADISIADKTFEDLINTYATYYGIEIRDGYSIFSFNDSGDQKNLRIIKKTNFNKDIEQSIIFYVIFQAIRYRYNNQLDITDLDLISIFLEAIVEIIDNFPEAGQSILQLKLNLKSEDLQNIIGKQTIDKLISILRLFTNSRLELLDEQEKTQFDNTLKVDLDNLFEILNNLPYKNYSNYEEIKKFLKKILTLNSYNPFKEF